MFNELKLKKTEIYSLVLASAGIDYDIIKAGQNRFNIIIDPDNHTRAIELIQLYLQENKKEKRLPVLSTTHTYMGIWIVLVLSVAHLAMTRYNGHQDYIRLLGSSAHEVMQGQLYRIVTALLVHADGAHLAANIGGILIFGTVVCQILGGGLGVLMILLSGILGNFFNACFYYSAHNSIGASTAVFGAIGILSGHQLIRKIRWEGLYIRNLLPLGAGLALMAMLGSGKETTDVLAHLFGFLSGLLQGTALALVLKKPPREMIQAVCLIVVLSLLVVVYLMSHN